MAAHPTVAGSRHGPQFNPVVPTYNGPVVQSRDVEYAFTENLPGLLAELRCSLLISTYSTGNVVAVAARDEQVTPSFHTFERPMGMALKPGMLAVGTRNQVWCLRDAPDVAARLVPHGQYDACYLTRLAHVTGNIQCHEMAWVGEELWLVNTLFSCLCTCHPSYSFAPRWRPPFISAMTPEDRCHLNGLAVAEGKVRYVTALGETDTRQGWRPGKATGGCLIDVASGAIVSRGLAMPHSPRVVGDRVYLLNSGLGQLVTVDVASGRVDVVASLPGYTRGLTIRGHHAFVALSKVRATSSLEGVPIAQRPAALKCGVVIVDLRTGRPVGHFEFTAGIDELFDVQVVPGTPYIAGPLAERDGSQALWTVPPERH